jgi:hypothetical protein
MLQTGFEPVIPACERSQAHFLDRTATGIGIGKSNGKDTIKTLSGMGTAWYV